MEAAQMSSVTEVAVPTSDFDGNAPVRFDIITAVGDAGAFEIEHIKEAFYPPVF